MKYADEYNMVGVYSYDSRSCDEKIYVVQFSP